MTDQGYRVISMDKATGRTAVVQDNLHGKPLTEDQAKRFMDRFYAASDDPDIAYLVEPNL